LELEPHDGLLITEKMAEVALTSVIAACQWFMEQKKTNDEVIVCILDMGDSIERILPVLLSLNTQGLHDASSACCQSQHRAHTASPLQSEILNTQGLPERKKNLWKKKQNLSATVSPRILMPPCT
jgi:hypothetical protein